MNTETKFTPGQWTASNHDDNDDVVIRRSDDVIIANLEVDGYNLTDDEINANANLIEAAPDMYNELQIQIRNVSILLEMINGKRRKDSNEIIAAAESLKKAKSAINKANGI